MSEHDDQTTPEPEDQAAQEPEGTADDAPDASSAAGDHDAQEAEETRRRQEEFAREHDPADHDVAAGEDFRQPGDWVAGDDEEPQQLETDQATLTTDGEVGGGDDAGDGQRAAVADDGDHGGAGADGHGEEIRDGGHG
ncbi:hypothetical protein BJF86_03195 [Serinicoccus sp. CNJ-927]|uniref:hypothetical protein n=1 Tax=Serinicoccus sp. CNJ-927 TaxID=1904970 RepID=UPI000968852D|nr:hypothetical protein [Serinicoccus sp. CNJ-927]OLT42004.1 hypothetical protein BJF86_03195 [Serinicoccus sp. CNJ-927]